MSLPSLVVMLIVVSSSLFAVATVACAFGLWIQERIAAITGGGILLLGLGILYGVEISAR